MFASLAAVSVVAGPASHAHPVAPKGPRDPTPHAYASFCVGVPAVARCPPPAHRMRVAGNTLEASCCRTCRRRCAKCRLRRLLAAADHASALPRARRRRRQLRVRALRTKCDDSQHTEQGPGGEGRVSTRDSGARCKQVQCVAGGPAAEDSHTHLRDCGREWWDCGRP